jgi:hypothetical protein
LPNAGSPGANLQSQLDDTPLASLGALAEHAQSAMDDTFPCEGQPVQPSMAGGPMEGVLAALADTPTDDEALDTEKPAKRQKLAGETDDEALDTEKPAKRQKLAGEKPTEPYQLQPPRSPPERKSPTEDEALLQQVPVGLRTQAIKNFASAKSMHESQVNWSVVAGSPEGAIYWVSADTDMCAQSAMVQRMKRALPEVI